MSLNYKSFFKEEAEQSPGEPFWGDAGAGALFLAKDTGRFLIFLRSGRVNESGTWNLVGGKLDYGENAKQGVEREVEEETGYDGDYRMNLIHTFRHKDFRYDNFLVIVPMEFNPQLNWEHDDFRWVEYGEWPVPLHFGLADVIKHAGDTLRRIVDAIKKKNSMIPEAAMPVAITVPTAEVSTNFFNYIKQVENAAKVGYEKRVGDTKEKWYPINSPEGGNDTIAWGHKLKNDEIKRFNKGITDREAEELLENDINIAMDIVTNYHDTWVTNTIPKCRAYAAANTNNPHYLFYMNIKPTDPVFRLDNKQMEMLIDFAYNLGSLKKFPKFAESVFKKDWETARKEYKRKYTDAKGKKHELGRNAVYYNQFLKPMEKQKVAEENNSDSNISFIKKGLVDDGVWEYEIKSLYSYLRYRCEPDTKTFYLDNIGTPDQMNKNKGHATELLEVFFEYIKSQNGTLDSGAYTTSGMAYIKPTIERLSREYGVRIVNGNRFL